MSLRYIPLITQTILTTDTFHRQEQITVTLSSLKIVSLKKIFTFRILCSAGVAEIRKETPVLELFLNNFIGKKNSLAGVAL